MTNSLKFMWSGLTYNKKCLALMVGFILFLFIGYKLSFSKTFELKSEIAKKEKNITWLKEKEKEIPFLKAKIAMIEKAYNSVDSISIRDKLTGFISDFAEKNECLVTEIPSFSFYKNQNLSVQTNIFTVNGKFNNLLRLLWQVENEFKISAKVMSARFFSVKDMQNKRKNLYLTLVTQSFNQVENK